jgi:hypothetical protein
MGYTALGRLYQGSYVVMALGEVAQSGAWNDQPATLHLPHIIPPRGVHTSLSGRQQQDTRPTLTGLLSLFLDLHSLPLLGPLILIRS